MSATNSLKVGFTGLSNYAKGVIAGIVSAMAFGFIPVFSKPMLSQGMSTECVLFYRFLFSSIILALILKAQHQPLLVKKSYVPSLALEAVFYSFSSGFLMLGYNYMSGGVTTVIHFTYPIFVMVISLVVFKERIRLSSLVSILIALVGIYCLSVLGGDASFIPGVNRVAGVIIVLISGLAWGSCIVGVNKTKVHSLPSLVFTFWMLTICAVFFLVISVADGTMQIITSPFQWFCFLGIALVATILANLTLVFSARYVGSTLAAILGALEPSTAVVMCILFFGEQLNGWITVGIALVFAAVLIVILKSKK